jgi:hypothetical protein
MQSGQMSTELGFTHIIRTNFGARPEFPVLIKTVEQAIDGVQELPPVMLKLDRWRPVTRALWSALDFPNDAIRLEAADKVLCAALEAEGWLDESPVP